MSAKAKPCPFCKSINFGLNDTKEWVACSKCWAEGPFAATEEEAIAAWNTRAGKKA